MLASYVKKKVIHPNESLYEISFVLRQYSYFNKTFFNFCLYSTDLWECPSGYLLFQETCYKLFRETKNHIRAQRHCENEGKGGKLGSPSTHMQVYNDHLIVHKVCLKFKMNLLWLIASNIY